MSVYVVCRLPILHTCFVGFLLVWGRGFFFIHLAPVGTGFELSSIAFNQIFRFIIFEFSDDGSSFVLLWSAEMMNSVKCDVCSSGLSGDWMRVWMSSIASFISLFLALTFFICWTMLQTFEVPDLIVVMF